MGKIPQELIEQAALTNLVAYCQVKGIALVREGNNEFVIKDNDSLYISANEPHKWYRHSTSEGGKAIDFCMKYLGMTFKQAIEDLTSTPIPDITIETVKPYTAETAPNQKRVIAYLCKKRCISYDLVKDLIQDNKLYQDTNGNCTFVITDFNGKKIGAELHGTGEKRFKGQTNPHNGFGFSMLMGCKVQTLAFFESSIDLISFYQLYKGRTKNDALLVSMGGLNPSVIQNYRSHYPDVEVILCVDNDERGKEFARQYKFRHVVPANCKDWNEKLCLLEETIKSSS